MPIRPHDIGSQHGAAFTPRSSARSVSSHPIGCSISGSRKLVHFYKPSPSAAIDDALHEGARSQPEKLPEVGDKMRLVVVARVCGDPAPVVGGLRATQGTLQANRSREILRPDADALHEGTAKVARCDSQLLRDVLHSNLVSFKQPHRAACEPRRCWFECLESTNGDRLGESVDHLL